MTAPSYPSSSPSELSGCDIRGAASDPTWRDATQKFRRALCGPGHDADAIRLHLCAILQRTGLTVGRRLGSGTYGLLFEAATASGTRAAVKVALNSTTWQNYCYLEPCVMRTCRHPNIVRVYEIIEPICSFTMELCYGALSRLLQKRTEWLPPSQIHSWLDQCFSALAYIHERGIIHGDIKPANILHCHDATTLKICDFGMMRYEGLYEDEAGLCTFIFTPPELLVHSSGCVTKAADVWAMGLVALHMVELWHIGELSDETKFGLLMMLCKRFGTPTPETWPGLSTLDTWNDLYPKFPPPAPAGSVLLMHSDKIKDAPPALPPQVMRAIADAVVMCPARRGRACEIVGALRAPPPARAATKKRRRVHWV